MRAPFALVWALLLLMALAVRLWNLGGFPGFEFDEGTAAVVARSMLDQHTLPLVGEKIYRGPIYEWLVAPFLAAGGSVSWAARMPAALLGWGTVLVAAAIARRRLPEWLALGWTALLAFHPWFLATSRIAHSACIVPFFVFVAAWAFTSPIQAAWQPFAGGFALGLAFQGHLYAAVLVPVFLFSLPFWKRWRESLAVLIGWIFGALPLIVANLSNNFASIQVFLAGNEGHLAGDSAFPSRWLAYFRGLALALHGRHFWLDTHEALAGRFMALPWVLPLLVVVSVGLIAPGLLRPLRDSPRFPGTLWLTWLAAVLLAVPAVTKTLSAGGVLLTLPTYLDAAMPAALLCVAEGLVLIHGRSPGWARVCLGAALTGEAAFLAAGLLPFVMSGGSGRWTIPWTAIEREVRMRDSQVTLASIIFGGVSPQLRAAFPVAHFEPFLLYPVPGPYGPPAKRLERVTLVRNLRPRGNFPIIPEAAMTAPRVVIDGSWEVLSYRSPGIRIVATAPELDLNLTAFADGGSLLLATASLRWMDRTMRIRSIERVNQPIPQPEFSGRLYLAPTDIDPRMVATIDKMASSATLETEDANATIAQWPIRLSYRTGPDGVPFLTGSIAAPDRHKVSFPEGSQVQLW